MGTAHWLDVHFWKLLLGTGLALSLFLLALPLLVFVLLVYQESSEPPAFDRDLSLLGPEGVAVSSRDCERTYVGSCPDLSLDNSWDTITGRSSFYWARAELGGWKCVPKSRYRLDCTESFWRLSIELRQSPVPGRCPSSEYAACFDDFFVEYVRED